MPIIHDVEGTAFGTPNPMPVKLTGSNITDAQSGFIPGMGYNGATFDRWRNNIQGTLLASATRTSGTFSPNQTNHNARGVVITLNITASSGTGGLGIRIIAIDPVTNAIFGINAVPSLVTATGIYLYMLYPGASGGATTQTTGLALPRTWCIQVIHGDSSSYTYSVGYSLIL